MTTNSRETDNIGEIYQAVQLLVKVITFCTWMETLLVFDNIVTGNEKLFNFGPLQEDAIDLSVSSEGPVYSGN
jgi:hypothetical protein